MAGVAERAPRAAPRNEWPFRGHRTMAEVMAGEAGDRREGARIPTFTGRRFWPLDPRPEDVCIEDIAHALSLECRYGGHCRTFYSVAQHSALVSEALEREGRSSAVQLQGLMHDAAEAYLPDVARPVKPRLEGFARIEAEVELAIADAFGLLWPWSTAVKRIDVAILRDEAAKLMNCDLSDWHLPEPALGIDIAPWRPGDAERRFLERFAELWEAGP